MQRDNPFEKVEELLEQLDREFETTPLAVGEQDIPVDVRDISDAFVLTADLPGYAKDDIEVTLADRTLRIDTERETDVESESESYIRRERSHESSSRSVRLPEAIDEAGIEATHSNGVLTVTLPKQERGEGTQIDIE